MNNNVVYLHVKKGTRDVFYVGIGKKRRAYSNSQRNPYWNSIVSKYGREVEIINNELSWDDACTIEKELISVFGRKDNGTGQLCNMTDGGDGIPNLSKEARIKISNSKIGKPMSEEARRKNSEAKSGPNHPNWGKKLSKETRRKISEAQKGEKGNNFGKTFSKELREKLSKAHKGQGLGRKLSDETKRRMSESAKKRWSNN